MSSSLQSFSNVAKNFLICFDSSLCLFFVLLGFRCLVEEVGKFLLLFVCLLVFFCFRAVAALISYNFAAFNCWNVSSAAKSFACASPTPVGTRPSFRVRCRQCFHSSSCRTLHQQHYQPDRSAALLSAQRQQPLFHAFAEMNSWSPTSQTSPSA